MSLRIGSMVVVLIGGCLAVGVASDIADCPAQTYFGQKPPGVMPELFAPGIISDAGYRLHGMPTFTPDGREVVWTVVPPQFMYMRLTDSGWTKAEPLPIEGRGGQGACFSPDGSRLYYQAAYPDGYGSADIWYIERTDSGWSAPVNMGSPPNSEVLESQPSLTVTGDVYFTGWRDSVGMNRGIYCSEFVDGKYTAPYLLDATINTAAIEYTPFISPDGKSLLFASSRPTDVESDLKLYVSYRDDDGSWGEPINVNEKMHWEKSARFPSLSPDGKYLFFYSDGAIYWVSAEVLGR
ncbi:MAG: PD40 domain-containing protein [candidate division Zixibacteria bacterium]|nr:PD40 domain-containing protein [candidate division Zixibacteria bacterium]